MNTTTPNQSHQHQHQHGITIKLITNADHLASLQVLGLEPDTKISPTSLLACLADSLTPANRDCHFIIAKSRLAASWRANPSLLTKNIIAKTEGFVDGIGWQSRTSQFMVECLLLRQQKPFTTRRWQSKPSVQFTIVAWLQVALPTDTLTIQLEDIPSFLQTHPEQLTYKVYRETNRRIRIIKQKTQWKIQQA